MSDQEKSSTNFCFPAGCFVPLVLYIFMIGLFIGYVIAEPVSLFEFGIGLISLVVIAVWGSFVVQVKKEKN